MLERRLDAETFLALVIDGKTFAEDGMVTAVGVTVDGRTVILGFVQTATENRRVCAAFLRALVERGFRFEEGLLVVTDGEGAPRRCGGGLRHRGRLAALSVAQTGERGELFGRETPPGNPANTPGRV